MENSELLQLETQKANLVNYLNTLVYGSIRTRIHGGIQYIYVRRPKNGEMKFELVGEFTRELYDMVLNNCKKAKFLRNELRYIERQIKSLQSAPTIENNQP